MPQKSEVEEEKQAVDEDHCGEEEDNNSSEGVTPYVVQKRIGKTVNEDKKDANMQFNWKKPRSRRRQRHSRKLNTFSSN